MSVQAADPRRIGPREAIAVLSLGLDGVVEAVSADDGEWTVRLVGGGALRWRDGAWSYEAPDGTVTALPDGDVLHHEPARRAGLPWELKAAIGVLLAVSAAAAALPWVLILVCFGIAASVPTKQAHVVVEPGVRAVLEHPVDEGDALTVWLDLEMQPAAESWALTGTLAIDGVEFPLTIAPGAEVVPGLQREWEKSLHRELEPGGEVVEGRILVGAVPPGDARTVRIELEAHEEATGLRNLRLLLEG